MAQTNIIGKSSITTKDSGLGNGSEDTLEKDARDAAAQSGKRHRKTRKRRTQRPQPSRGLHFDRFEIGQALHTDS